MCIIMLTINIAAKYQEKSIVSTNVTEQPIHGGK